MIRTISVKAQVSARHEMCIPVPKDVPVGPVDVTLTLATEGEQSVHTLGELADSELFGAWKDRTDIKDSVEFARRLREEAWKRSA